ncbi:cadherin-99C, partial [Nephila pilipes]
RICLKKIEKNKKNDPFFIYLVEAKDADDIDGSEPIVYSIYHVSNEGLSKFRIHRSTGNVQVVDKVSAVQQYSITVQATDPGGRSYK